MAATTKEYPLLSRDDIESGIAEGRKLMIIDQYVIKADPWLAYHPGGDKAILHMVGRDATDEATIMHSPEAREQMKRYRIGRIDGHWANFIPPIQGGIYRSKETIEQEKIQRKLMQRSGSSSSGSREPSPVFDLGGQEGLRHRSATSQSDSASTISGDFPPDAVGDGMTYLNTITREKIDLDLSKYPALDMETQTGIVAKYRELHERIKEANLYQCNYWAYAAESVSYLFLAIMTYVCLQHGSYFWGGLALGAMWHQLVFTAHDAGHMGITHDYYFDSIIAIIIADFIGGLSMGWWKLSHNIHHIVTNSPEHDPDIEHMPLFAISHRFLENLRSTYYDKVMEYDAFAKVLLKVQAYTYYPILSLARFNLYRLSWDYLLAGRGPKKGQAAWLRWLEIAGQVFFWTWFGYGVCYKMIPDNWSRFVFVMTCNISSSPLHLQIVLSHFAMSTADLGPSESFPQKMLRTTMDVDCPPWLDWIHGGLQFQAIHHLYPRIPRHNLRATQKLVQEFCNDVGIPYALYGFVSGNGEVVGKLAEVSRQAKILAKCQETIVKKGDFFGH